MSKTVDSYYILYNNPFLLSEILIEFYKNHTSTQKKDILLAYLVFPITLYEESCKALQVANSKRTIRTFLKKKVERLYGLEQRLEEFKKLTNHCLQLAVDNGSLTIDQDLNVKIKDPTKSRPHNNADGKYLSAAANLARMFNGVDLVTIYRQFGIKKI